MPILTSKDILKRIEAGDISFKPGLDSFQIQGHSVDLRLGYTFLIPKTWKHTPQGRVGMPIVDFDNMTRDMFEVVELEAGQYFELLPQEHVLVSTFETVKVPDDLMAVLYPRSSTNRKGLSLDLTGIVDSGYEGQLILPIRNSTVSNTIRLYPGERICQIIFEELTGKTEMRKSKYHKRDIAEGAQKEKEDEAKLIKSGAITQLKKDFKVA
ncbi:MAG: deoxycytidine triphosphate deaminase [Candidatus Taylorbacteria bacterium]|nr:deoxycytidine triphosphate deaminase [Candidatus Taylorbacteria bacterium]